MPKIDPFLWFDGKAEEAAKFYVSVVKNSKILEISHVTEAVPGENGSVLTISFELDGQKFVALNGGPEFTFTPAVSFAINCDTQEEVDYYWDKLTDGGKEIQCGWLEDKFGVSWQITPTEMAKFITDPDPERVDRVMRAMMPMVKLDIAKLQAAYDGSE